jgi:O-methyltransferase involved in polyketide biosynthesis
MPDTMIDGSGDFYGGVESRAHMAKMGEPLLFGIADNGIERFLEDRGFRPLSLMTPETLEQRYLIMTNGTLHGKVAGYVRMAEAEVQQKL